MVMRHRGGFDLLLVLSSLFYRIMLFAVDLLVVINL